MRSKRSPDTGNTESEAHKMKTISKKVRLSSVMIRLMTIAITLSMILAAQVSVSRTFACDDWDEWEEEDWIVEDYDDWEYGDPEWDNYMEFDDSDGTYSVDEASMLDGLFKLSADGQTLTEILSDDEPGTTIQTYDGNSVDWWLCSSYPTEIARGEKLVLAGTEWGNRSENDKKAGVMYYQELNLLGYTNLILSDMKASDVEALNGIDISGINEDLDSVNSAISGEGLKYHEYFVLNDSFTPNHLLLTSTFEADAEVGYYEGTEYIPMNVSMCSPCFYYEKGFTDSKVLPVEKTNNGYFVIDTSGLSSGTYAIMSYSGVFTIEIL